MLRGLPRPMRSFAGSSRIGLLFAVLMAVATGVVIFVALGDDGGEAAPATGIAAAEADRDTRTVVTVATSVPAGTLITADMLEVRVLPVDSVTDGAFSDPAQVVGQYSRIPLFPGEQLLEAKVADAAAAGERLRFVVPFGLRAMAIEVNKVVAVGGLIRPGDRVDVYAIEEVTSVDAVTGEIVRRGTRSTIIAQNIEVLAIEQALLRVLPSENNAERDPTGSGTLLDQPEIQPTSSVVTLTVTPAEAARILIASEEGTIRLAARGFGDTAVVAATEGGELESNSLLAVDETSSLSYVIPAGMRAMAISVDKIVGVGGLLRPNSRVDVLAVLEAEAVAPDLSLVQVSRATTLAQNVEVLAVEQALDNVVGEEGASIENPLDQAPAQPLATVVTLAVTPELAQQILLAETQGTIRLAARAAGDDEIRRLPDSLYGISLLNGDYASLGLIETE